MKKIAITQRLAIQESYAEQREILSCEWGSFLIKYGMLPIPLSYAIPVSYYSSIIDGVILSGGNDLSIFCSDVNSLKRDKYEKAVIEFCLSYQIPLLGVCRGAQMLAHYFNSELCRVDGHVGRHKIFWSDGIGDNVNSYHNYVISRLGVGLNCLARSEDNKIEAFSHKVFPVFGMMWHPEREENESSSTKRIFKEFLKDKK